MRELPIELSNRGDVPLQRSLYDALRDAMLNGRLPPSTRLPSSRDLGRQLGVARGTVVAVYEQLRSEGYLAARIGSGTVVADTLPDRWFHARTPDAKPVGRPSVALSRRGKLLSSSPFVGSPRTQPRPFRAHVPAVDAFPSALWGRLVSKRARNDERLLLSDADVRGYRPLRAALAEHLRVSRGVACTEEQLVILPSVQQALDLAARLLLDPGDEIWMEDPGYTGARVVLAAAGAKVVPVPVDAHGLDVAAGVRRAPSARMAYVTPGHQAPLGVTMTLERRMALLSWAAKRRALVIEDDYDSEYRYEGKAVPALFGLDRAGVVLHTGTFSKTMLPSLRLAYAVVPERLVDAFVSAKSVLDRFTPPLGQAALADFIEGGHFGRHLRGMRALYAERRRALLDAIGTELDDAVEVVGASAGLDVAVRLPKRVEDRVAERELEALGIESIALSRQALARRDVNGLLFGFAAFSPARLRKSVATLAAVTG